MRWIPPPLKLGIYALEGVNAFACSYYFNYLLFVFRDDHGFGNAQNLAVGAVHGLLYVVASWLGGKFGQRYGYFTSLRIGFAGMALALGMATGSISLPPQLLALAFWTVSMCFTWPMLEALVSEHEPAEALPHRIGLYNVTWATASALALFAGGAIFEALGRPSIYWLPAALCGLNFLATFPLKRAHDRWLAQAPPMPPAAHGTEGAGRSRQFLTLAWVANPFAYMSINTITAVMPGIAQNVGLSIAQAGMLMSIWFIVRAASFVVLWFWHGWHYRFRWFAAAFVMLAAGFLTIMVTRQIWLLAMAQVFYGWATGLIYYSSLFYAMDGSEAKGEHGGTHEAFIGAGICAGPAVGATSLWLLPHSPNAAAWAVSAFLLAGLAGIAAIRGRAASRPK